MNNAQHKALNQRALIALVMVCSFLWLPVAGVALHFLDGAPFQPTRHLLMTIHNFAAIVFLISATLHVRLNWKPLMNYVRSTAGHVSHLRREVGLALLIVMTPLTLGILHVFALSGR